MEVEPDSTTAEQEFSVGDDVLCDLTTSDQLYLGSVVQVNRSLKKCLVKFLDETETWCSFSDMKLFGTAEDGAQELDHHVTCVVCKATVPTTSNQLVVCACGRGYHQRCLLPVIPSCDTSWRCRICAPGAPPKRGERTKVPLIAPAPPQAVAGLQQCMQCGSKDPWHKSMVRCRRCTLWIHASCMVHKRTLLPADRFYVYICSGCNRGKELCCRMALTWPHLVHLVLYNLNLNHHTKYHDLDDGILPYLTRVWHHLNLPTQMEKKSQLERRILVEETLQTHQNVFRSGREVKKKGSLWGLRVRGAPRPPRVTLPPRGQVDASHVTVQLVPPLERPLQNGHVNSSRKGEESDSGRSCSPPDPPPPPAPPPPPPHPHTILDNSAEFLGLGLVKRSVPFPAQDTSTAADARFRSHAVRRAARLLRNMRSKPPPSPSKQHSATAAASPRLSDSEDEALRSLVPNTISSFFSPRDPRDLRDPIHHSPKATIRKRPQRNLLEARLNSTEAKLYNPSPKTLNSTPPNESPTKKKLKKDGKVDPKRKLVQKTILDFQRRRSEGGEDSINSCDERLRAVLTTRRLSEKDIMVRNGVVVRRKRRRGLMLPPRAPLPAIAPSAHVPPPAGPDWWLLTSGPPDLDALRALFCPMTQGRPYSVLATRELPGGQMEALISDPLLRLPPSGS